MDGPGDPHRVFALLAEFGVRTVLGNHDAWCLAGTNLILPEATPRARLHPSETATLRQLPRTIEVRPGFLLCHGLGDDFLARLGQDDRDEALADDTALGRLQVGGWRLVVNGHSHRPLARKVGSTFYLGAGALGTDRGLVLVDPDSGAWTGWAVRGGTVEPSDSGKAG